MAMAFANPIGSIGAEKLLEKGLGANRKAREKGRFGALLVHLEAKLVGLAAKKGDGCLVPLARRGTL